MNSINDFLLDKEVCEKLHKAYGNIPINLDTYITKIGIIDNEVVVFLIDNPSTIKLPYCDRMGASNNRLFFKYSYYTIYIDNKSDLIIEIERPDDRQY